MVLIFPFVILLLVAKNFRDIFVGGFSLALLYFIGGLIVFRTDRAVFLEVFAVRAVHFISPLIMSDRFTTCLT